MDEDEPTVEMQADWRCKMHSVHLTASPRRLGLDETLTEQAIVDGDGDDEHRHGFHDGI